jgi:hypothetical protein
MEFDWDFQELMKFEQGAHDCTWMTHQLMKGNSRIQTSELCTFL